MRILSIIILFCMLHSCQTDKKQSKTVELESTKYDLSNNEEATVADKIANAHGIEQWSKVNQIAFTFNVDANGNHIERSWVWNPNTDDVTMISANDTVSYNRKSVDSLSLNADKGFINDKFWLLAPFQLIWDSGTEISEPIKEKAPISAQAMNKITLTYTGDGGYTPGDAYDFFYTDDFKIKEWIFRKGNAAEPTMMTTFENYGSYKGLEIARDHKQKNKDWNLYFTNVEMKLL